MTEHDLPRTRAEREAWERFRANWPEFLASKRRDRLTRIAALGRGYDDDAPLTEVESAQVDEFIRGEFKRLHAERRRSAHADRWRRFARVMPSRAFAIVTDEPDDTLAIRAMRKWALEEATSLALVLGPPGTGKTCAAIWWAWNCLETHEPPRFVTGAEFARSSRYGGERDALLGASALILDDLGVENQPTDVDELVDAYYRDDVPLVITSNLTQPQFAERYGERVVDRLREAGTVITVPGPSLRRVS